MERMQIFLKPTVPRVLLVVLLVVMYEFGRIQGEIIGDIMQMDPTKAQNALYQFLSHPPFYPRFWDISAVVTLPLLPIAWLLNLVPIFGEWFNRILSYCYFYMLACLIAGVVQRKRQPARTPGYDEK